jgi:hypothetical protein
MKNIFKLGLLLMGCVLINSTTIAQKSKPTRAERQAENMEWKMRNMNSLGAEIGEVKLRNEYGTEGMWVGKNLDLGGMFSMGYMNGQGTYTDSLKTVRTNGKLFYIGMQMFYPVLKSNVFDVAPFFGAGIQTNQMQNNIKYEEQGKENSLGTLGLGGYISAGVGVTVGPFVVKAKYTGIATANFNKANMIKSTQWFPSVTVGIKPGRMLLNPYLFTADGLSYRQDVIDEKITRTHLSPSSDELTYTATVRTTFSEGSVSIYDVRPYVFLGPEYITGNQSSSTGNSAFYGLVGGFRFGTLYMDASYSKGDMPFRDPIKDYEELQRGSPYYGKVRMDGYFKNSTRYGAKVGADLIAWFAKSNFIPYTNSQSLQQATSFYAAILTFGVGKMNFGQLAFYNVGADTTYTTYQEGNPQSNLYNALPAIAPGYTNSLKYICVGLQLLIGTVGFDWNLFYVKGDGGYTRWGKEASISWKLPIARVFRIGRVMRLEKKGNW